MNAEITNPGTMVERWLFDGDSPGKRCSWPTADCARLIAAAIRSGDENAPRLAIAVLDAYSALLDHPTGTNPMVKRLRALRSAEAHRPPHCVHGKPFARECGMCEL